METQSHEILAAKMLMVWNTLRYNSRTSEGGRKKRRKIERQMLKVETYDYKEYWGKTG